MCGGGVVVAKALRALVICIGGGVAKRAGPGLGISI